MQDVADFARVLDWVLLMNYDTWGCEYHLILIAYPPPPFLPSFRVGFIDCHLRPHVFRFASPSSLIALCVLPPPHRPRSPMPLLLLSLTLSLLARLYFSFPSLRSVQQTRSERPSQRRLRQLVAAGRQRARRPSRLDRRRLRAIAASTWGPFLRLFVQIFGDTPPVSCPPIVSANPQLRPWPWSWLWALWTICGAQRGEDPGGQASR